MKYTPAMVKEIIGYIESGLSNKSACQACGIAEKTFYEWMEKSDFSKKVNKAHGKFKQTHLKNITKHSKNDWRASAELLKLCHPKEYSQNANLNLGVQEGIKTVKIELTDE